MSVPRAASAVSDVAIQYAKNLSCWFRDYITAIKHGRLHPFTPLERKTREATRNEPWYLSRFSSARIEEAVAKGTNGLSAQRAHGSFSRSE